MTGLSRGLRAISSHPLSISSPLPSLNVLTWCWVTRSPPFPCLRLPFTRPRCRPVFALMGRTRAKQSRQTFLPGGCGRREAPAVFLGSSTAPNDTTDPGECIRRRHVSLQFLVTGFSRLYFYTWWKQDVQHRIEEGCILGEIHWGAFCVCGRLASLRWTLFSLVLVKLLCALTCPHSSLYFELSLDVRKLHWKGRY